MNKQDIISASVLTLFCLESCFVFVGKQLKLLIKMYYSEINSKVALLKITLISDSELIFNPVWILTLNEGPSGFLISEVTILALK